MDAVNLGVERRTDVGKGAARKLRRADRIPAVAYREGQPPLQLSLDPDEIELIMRRSENRNTLFRFELDGQEHICIVKDVQRHPLTRRLMHLDFYEVRASEPLQATIRITAVGRALGTRKGGTLKQFRRFVNVRCTPDRIPAVIEVDVSELDLNQYIKVSRITPPEGVEILFENDFNVMGVVGKGVEETEEAGA